MSKHRKRLRNPGRIVHIKTLGQLYRALSKYPEIYIEREYDPYYLESHTGRILSVTLVNIRTGGRDWCYDIIVRDRKIEAIWSSDNEEEWDRHEAKKVTRLLKKYRWMGPTDAHTIIQNEF